MSQDSAWDAEERLPRAKKAACCRGAGRETGANLSMTGIESCGRGIRETVNIGEAGGMHDDTFKK